MRRPFTLLIAGVLLLPLAVTTGSAASGPAPGPITVDSVVPAPAEVVPSRAAPFRITATTVITATGAAVPVAEQLAAALRPATGHPLPVRAAGGPAIELRLNAAADPWLGDEGYRLEIGAGGVALRANRPAGLFAGTQTVRQLLPPQIEATSVRRADWTVPAGVIRDRPRFPYRGAMLDLARHFHPPADVKRYIDEISRFKINYLHLHLTDDQGWRIEIDGWPRLTTVGGGPGTGVRGLGGGHLTQDDYRDLVRYAAERYVTIVPEVDMPGHVNAAQVAYPELTCDGVAPRPRTDIRVGYSSLCTGKEVTYRFAEDVIRQLAALTPGPYLHLGGDEAHSTGHADYLAFEQRVLPLVARYGKIAYGWQEIAEAPAATGAVIQYWAATRDSPPVAAAAAAGAKVVLSPADRTYLDMQYDLLTPGGLHWAGTIEVDAAYGWDPATWARGVPAEAVLGVEAPLWSETLRDYGRIEFQAFPRLPAIAELGWSPRAAHDWTSFRERLGAYGRRWTRRGVHFYRSPRIRWS
ncbi:beta-N-acetylhexosaminidase [Actinoplanes teichomyceticus]|uniref:beta-N-acetylhexosaminidase n=1 Tax=Actinoplanes teichomyceticus TaxID=1867 RepID=A0A561WQP7_ACTTI|nr:beta-N-acetylhexosaminidase [Actinoplanes teichomyceticus]TWG26192.1 hexosaminidase [Actinoplanes teichomyceticus]GIF11270.1 beta-N-acetylhexosaminidase [Actinoplanes teichomyceticus]